MIALFASIFALGIGPLIYQTFGPMRRTDSIVSGFILVVITATLLTEVLPQTFTIISYLAIALALLGFVGPTLIEKMFARTANRTHILTILLGILGLVIHASFDGAALYSTHDVIDGERLHSTEQLTLAIILHRLPVGLTIWWLLRPLIGEKYSLLTLLAMALATSGGYVLSMQLSDIHTSSAMAMLQAFISGSLMHVILHKHHEDGCMHTSHSHLHHQKQHSKLAHTNQPKSNMLTSLADRWEVMGMIAGITLMAYLHFSH
ncbi:MAG: hypothetical protein COA86_09395 [Kangiella sp.]|nr:MAG: hypothetical protein COA86_09395 [Kangiella sp.]